jgi:hypothetical protein
MHKQLTEYKSLRPIAASAISPTAVRLHSKLFFKPKFKSAATTPYMMNARLAVNGQQQPLDSYFSTYAATADDACKQAMIAAYAASAVKHHRVSDLLISDFDLNGAFLQHTLTPDNSPRQIVVKLPSDIPHPLAGQWAEILQAVYGLKHSNNIFDTGFAALLNNAGFLSTPSEPRIFIKKHPADPLLSCSVAMHVDDGLICSTHRPYYAELLAILTKRYGTLKFNAESTSNTGYSIRRGLRGSVTLNQEGYLRRMLKDNGADHLPFVPTPSLPDLFHAPTDTTPVDVKHFRKLIGCLIYLLKTRHDIRKEVQFLASRSTAPTQSCLDKVIRVLAFLNSTPSDGVRFYSDDPTVHV